MTSSTVIAPSPFASPAAHAVTGVFPRAMLTISTRLSMVTAPVACAVADTGGVEAWDNAQQQSQRDHTHRASWGALHNSSLEKRHPLSPIQSRCPPPLTALRRGRIAPEVTRKAAPYRWRLRNVNKRSSPLHQQVR